MQRALDPVVHSKPVCASPDFVNVPEITLALPVQETCVNAMSDSDLGSTGSPTAYIKPDDATITPYDFYSGPCQAFKAKFCWAVSFSSHLHPPLSFLNFIDSTLILSTIT